MKFNKSKSKQPVYLLQVLAINNIQENIDYGKTPRKTKYLVLDLNMDNNS